MKTPLSKIAKEEYERWKALDVEHGHAAECELLMWSQIEFTLKDLRARYDLYHPSKKHLEEGVTKIETLKVVRARRLIKRQAVKELGIKIKNELDKENK